MQPKNQVIYQQFVQTINEMKQREVTLEKDIETVKDQLKSMELELSNLKQSLLSHQGGMSTIELLTNNNIALIEGTDEQPLTLSQFPTQQPQAAPPTQQQYAQQPTQQVTPSQPPITPQAQQTFAPAQYPSPGDIAAAQAIQGPQIVQGPPPANME